ncbi:MAG: hypothetical protein KDA21_01610 [Phycisphaerales bacterium]|nr:hypothetical protein [Phycisphaerales bacterium]
MVEPVALAGVLGFLLGLGLLVVGCRGRRLDLNHYCRRCGYQEGVMIGDSCPECGTRLLLSSRRIAFDMNHPVLARFLAVTRRGRRRKRPQVMAAGILLLLVGGSALGSAAWMQASSITLAQLKPLTLVFAEAASQDAAVAGAALLELDRRNGRGRLSPGQQARVERLRKELKDRQIASLLARTDAAAAAAMRQAPAPPPRRIVPRTPARDLNRGTSVRDEAPSARVLSTPAPDLLLMEAQLIDADAHYQNRAMEYREKITEAIGREEVTLTLGNEIKVSRVRPPLPAPARPVPVSSVLDEPALDARLEWTSFSAMSPVSAGLCAGVGRPASVSGRFPASMSWARSGPATVSAAAPLGTVRVESPLATRPLKTRIATRRAH